jgi:hypothetical protein
MKSIDTMIKALARKGINAQKVKVKKEKRELLLLQSYKQEWLRHSNM